MVITLPPDVQSLLDERVRSGEYSSQEAIVAAAVTKFLKTAANEGEFGPGELDALIEEGARDVERGDVLDGRAVFSEIRGLRHRTH